MLTVKDKIDQAARPGLEAEYVGIVEDAEDPNMQGRLRVRVPELYGDVAAESLPWAQPQHGFGGGSDYGQFMIPPKGSKVLIKLWRGHSWFPVWQATHYFLKEAPEEARITPPDNYVLIKTPKKSLIDLHDGNSYIRVKDSAGNFIIIATKDNELRIHVNQDLLIEIGANSDETVSQHKRISVLGNYDLSVQGNINIRASGIVAIDGSQVLINSGAASPEAPRQPKDVSHEHPQESPPEAAPAPIS